MNVNASTMYFFLGGRDLEMKTIAAVLRQRNILFADKSLSWAARASDYIEEIKQVLADGFVPILVELRNDLEEPLATSVRIVDHHGRLAGIHAPTSLEQVLNLLGVEAEFVKSNREWQLVIANDRGHIRGLKQLNPPAGDEEILATRLADLKAQGVAQREIDDAKAAVASALEFKAGGRLAVVHAPSDRTSLVAEMCEPIFEGPDVTNLLVIGPNEVGFYGDGDLVELLATLSKEAEAWYGGSLPEFGFWGAKTGAISFCPESELVAQLTDGAI